MTILFLYSALVIMVPGPVQRTNKKNKGTSRQIHYLIKILKTGLMSQKIDTYCYQESKVW